MGSTSQSIQKSGVEGIRMGISYPLLPGGAEEQAIISFFLHNHTFYYFSSTFQTEDYAIVASDVNQFFNSIQIYQ